MIQIQLVLPPPQKRGFLRSRPNISHYSLRSIDKIFFKEVMASKSKVKTQGECIFKCKYLTEQLTVKRLFNIFDQQKNYFICSSVAGDGCNGDTTGSWRRLRRLDPPHDAATELRHSYTVFQGLTWPVTVPAEPWQKADDWAPSACGPAGLTSTVYSSPAGPSSPRSLFIYENVHC